MKLSRFQSIFNGLNGVAKRVYEAVPISSSWSTYKIMDELQRSGSHMDLKAIQGCLGYMLNMGIIERDKDGEYIRTPLKMTRTPDEPLTTPPPTEEETMMATAPIILKNKDKAPVPVTPAAEPTTFDILARLAQRAQDLSDAAEQLREDIEKTAFHVQSEQDKHGSELTKLRQLKALLGSLND